MKHITLLFSLLTLFSVTGSGLYGQSDDVQRAGPITEIEFSETEFEWGEVIQGEKIQNVFYFTNTGDEPLIIVNAKGSCGCTVPRYPKEPIMPGETASLLVQFDSKNKKGKQSKRVTISANTDPVNTYLTIRGLVHVPEKTEMLKERFKDFDVDAATVSIYPNPSSDVVNLNLLEHKGKSVNVDIYNKLGQRVGSKNLESIGDTPISFDISQYENGNYTMSIKIEDANRIAKQFSVSH